MINDIFCFERHECFNIECQPSGFLYFHKLLLIPATYDHKLYNLRFLHHI